MTALGVVGKCGQGCVVRVGFVGVIGEPLPHSGTNAFFNELQEEQEAYETQETTPPFRLEKKQGR